MSVSNHHESVLLEEAVDALISAKDGIYVDATFGRGGHSKELLAHLSNSGQLIGIDKDPTAVSLGMELQQCDQRFRIVHGSFAEISNISGLKSRQVDGILADLGVSSPQLDNADRGFSFLKDGPLDMRMNTSAGPTAADWLASASEKEIARVLKEYGEEKFARRIASAIVEKRAIAPISTTSELAKIASDANPAWEKNKHPATRVFQAVRIQINNELGDLTEFLQQATELLRVGGKLVVISFHSLEDRIVKRFMRGLAKGPQVPAGVPIPHSEMIQPFKFISRPIKPSEEEISRNVRARSATMRILERVSDA